MLLSVPAAAQGGFPQGGFPQGGNFPQQGAGRNPALPGGAAAGRANTAGTTKTTATGKTNATTTKTGTARSDKAALEAAKYQLSNHRTDLIKATIDGYASSDDLTDPAVVRSISEDIEKNMPLVPSVPLEPVDHQALNNIAKNMVDQEYGTDDKKYASIVEAEAAAEFPLYKVGDAVVVNYNMGPKHFSVKGKLYRVTENAITVEDKVINLVDLSDEVRSRFDPRKNEYMRDRYKETHIHLLNRIKIEKRNDYYEKLKGEIFKRNETAGYIYDSQTDHWATAQEISKNYIERLVREKTKNQPKTRPAATQKTETAAADDFEESVPVTTTPDTTTAAETATAGAAFLHVLTETLRGFFLFFIAELQVAVDVDDFDSLVGVGEACLLEGFFKILFHEGFFFRVQRAVLVLVVFLQKFRHLAFHAFDHVGLESFRVELAAAGAARASALFISGACRFFRRRLRGVLRDNDSESCEDESCE
jgi:hypothetical protein